MNLLPVPQYTTAFVGRAVEIAAIAELLLNPQQRWVTLVGTSGTGKTRLSLQVEQQVRSAFRDGCVWIDLAPIDDLSLVLPAIARALQINEVASQDLLDTLVAALHDLDLLLILDNCEQVVAVEPQLTALVEGTERLHILATSQLPLNSPREHVFSVPPLAVPSQAPRGDLQALLEYPAVALFVQRIQAIQPSFTLSKANATAIIDICKRVQGLPLAIEVIAAHSDHITPNDLLLLVRNYLPSASAAMTPKLILKAVLDWNYRVLPEAARIVFSRLSVFVGGWTAGAARAVCRLPDERFDVDAALNLLTTKHLVLMRNEGRLRYHVLDAIHEYSESLLAEQAVAAQLYRQHAAFFHQLVHTTGEEPGQETLEPEQHNLRVAVLRLLRLNEHDAATSLAGDLGFFWYNRGHWSAGAQVLRTVIDQSPASAVQPSHRALALKWLGNLTFLRGDVARSRELLEASLHIYAAASDEPGTIAVYNNLSVIERSTNNYAKAEEYIRASLEGTQRLGNTGGTLASANNLITLLLATGKPAEALTVLESINSMLKNYTNPYGQALTLMNHGTIHVHLQQWQQAIPLLEQAREQFKALHNSSFWANSSTALAYAHLGLDQRGYAAHFLQEALSLRLQYHDTLGLIDTLEAVALFAAPTHAPNAATMLQLADTLRTQAGQQRSPSDQAQRERITAILDGQAVAVPAAPLPASAHDRTLANAAALLRAAAVDPNDD